MGEQGCLESSASMHWTLPKPWKFLLVLESKPNSLCHLFLSVGKHWHSSLQRRVQSTELKRTFAFSFDWATGFLPLCLNIHQWPWEWRTSPSVTSGFRAPMAVCSHSVSAPRSSEYWKNEKCLKQSVTNLVFSWESSTSSWDSYGRLNFSVNESTKMLIPLGC